MRIAAFFSFCVTLLTLTGCVGAFDPYQRPGNWAEEGSANETIAQQAANPGDLIHGESNPLTSGDVAATAIEKVSIVSGANAGSSSGSSSSSSSGSGGSSSSGTGATTK